MSRQKRPNGDFKETGFALCQRADGAVVKGPMARGSRDRVDVPLSCPPRSGPKPFGVYHEHPPDDSIKPSKLDMTSAQAAGLDIVCVGWKKKVKCYPVLT